MMDWEKKFTSILKDTDANLSRVKNKFQSSGTGNVTWGPRYYSTPIKRSTSLADIELASAPKYVPQIGLNQSFNGDLYKNGTNPSNLYTPYPSMQILQEKLDQQSNEIDHLRGMIHRMETDRQNYREQIRDLRNEIFQLTEKIGNKRRPDPGVERRIETMRREFLGEIQLLQSQMQITSAKGSNSNLSDTQLMSLNRDVLEIKHAFRDELDGYRRDIEILRSRMAKVELELASTLTNRRDVERRQDNLDRTLTSLAHKSPPVPQSTIALMNTNRQFERMQINELRSALSALKDKIDVLESSSQKFPSNSTPKKPKLFSNGISARKKSSPSSAILNGLNLSDDETDSDFTEFEPIGGGLKDTRMKSNDIDLKNVSDDDLDIDDLELSDDDLSDNYLSDPLENADFS